MSEGKQQDDPPGFDIEVMDQVCMDFWDEFHAAVPSLGTVYRTGEAAGFKRGFERGFEAARAQLIKAMAQAPISTEPAPLLIEGPKPPAPVPVPAPAPPPAPAAAARPAGRPPKPPAAPAPAPAPKPPAPKPAPAEAAAPAAPAPAPALPRWSPARVEVLSNGYLLACPRRRILEELNRLPGPRVEDGDLMPQIQALRVKVADNQQIRDSMTIAWTEPGIAKLEWKWAVAAVGGRREQIRKDAAAAVIARHQRHPPEAPQAAPPPPPPPPAPPPPAPVAPTAPPPPPPDVVRDESGPLWSPERDDILKDGWLCWVPSDDMLAEMNRVPGPTVDVGHVARRAEELRLHREDSHASLCRRAFAEAKAKGKDWEGAIGAVFDKIAEEEERQREASKRPLSAGAQAARAAVASGAWRGKAT